MYILGDGADQRASVSPDMYSETAENTENGKWSLTGVLKDLEN